MYSVDQSPVFSLWHLLVTIIISPISLFFTRNNIPHSETMHVTCTGRVSLAHGKVAKQLMHDFEGDRGEGV